MSTQRKIAHLAAGSKAPGIGQTLDSPTVGIGLFDRQARCIAVNEAFASKLGINGTAFKDKRLDQIFFENDSILMEAFVHVYRTGKSVRSLRLKAHIGRQTLARDFIVDLFSAADSPNVSRLVGVAVSDVTLVSSLKDRLLARELHSVSVTRDGRNDLLQTMSRALYGSLDLAYESMTTHRRIYEMKVCMRIRKAVIQHGGRLHWPPSWPGSLHEPSPDQRRAGPAPSLPATPQLTLRRPGTPPALSFRERQIVRLLANGMSNKEIAVELGLSLRTIEHYRSHMMAKLGLRSLADVVLFAVRNDLVRP